MLPRPAPPAATGLNEKTNLKQKKTAGTHSSDRKSGFGGGLEGALLEGAPGVVDDIRMFGRKA